MSAPGSKRRGNEDSGSANPRGDLALLVITSQCKHTGAETSCQEKIEKFSCFFVENRRKSRLSDGFSCMMFIGYQISRWRWKEQLPGR